MTELYKLDVRNGRVESGTIRDLALFTLVCNVEYSMRELKMILDDLNLIFVSTRTKKRYHFTDTRLIWDIAIYSGFPNFDDYETEEEKLEALDTYLDEINRFKTPGIVMYFIMEVWLDDEFVFGDGTINITLQFLLGINRAGDLVEVLFNSDGTPFQSQISLKRISFTIRNTHRVPNTIKSN